MNGNPEVAQRYPFDYDAMKKGDRIEPRVVEEITGVRRNHADYSLKTMALVKRIEAELWDRGKCYTVCVQEHGIAILTDLEASAYNADRFQAHRRGLTRANTKMAQVDTTDFSEESRRAHDRQLANQGAVLAAILAARRRELAGAAPGGNALPGPV